MAQDRASYSLRGQKVVIVGGTSGMGLGAARAVPERNDRHTSRDIGMSCAQCEGWFSQYP